MEAVSPVIVTPLDVARFIAFTIAHPRIVTAGDAAAQSKATCMRHRVTTAGAFGGRGYTPSPS